MHPRKNEFDQHPDEAIVKTTRYGRQSKQPVKYTDPVKSKRQLKEEEKEAKKAQELQELKTVQTKGKKNRRQLEEERELYDGESDDEEYDNEDSDSEEIDD